MIGLRHQLAAYSPISFTDCLKALASGLRVRRDPRPRLVELLRREYDADEVVLCGSGTQALQVAIGVAVNDFSSQPTVALPAYTCYDVASAAIGADLPVALYDVDPQTLGPRLDSLEQVLAAGAKILVVAPSYGIPVDWESVSKIAKAHGATVIEDAAQGHGASWRGRKLGTLAEFGVLSFGRGKGWTGGNGGAVLIRGRARANASQGDALPQQTRAAELMVSIALFAQWLLGRPWAYGLPRSIPVLHLGVTVYHSPRAPRAMTRSAAGAALASFARAEREARERKRVASLYTETFMKVNTGKMPDSPRDSEPGYLRFPILVNERESFVVNRSGEADELPREIRTLGVERGYPRSIARLPQIVERRVGSVQQWPGADRIVASLVTLPTHTRISVDELAKVVKLWDVSPSK